MEEGCVFGKVGWCSGEFPLLPSPKGHLSSVHLRGSGKPLDLGDAGPGRSDPWLDEVRVMADGCGYTGQRLPG